MENIFMGDTESDDDYNKFIEAEDINDIIKSKIENKAWSKDILFNIVDELFIYPMEPIFLKLDEDIYIEYKILYKPILEAEDKIINIKNEKK